MGRPSKPARCVAFAAGIATLQACALPAAAGTRVLYEQMDAAAPQSVLSLDRMPPADAYDTEAADDFFVPAGDLWSVTGVDVVGGINAGDAPPPSFNVRFYTNGSGNLPASLLAERLAQPYSGGLGDGDTAFIALDGPVDLGPGQHWVSVQAASSGEGDLWYWQDRSIQSNAPAAWRNPGGMYSSDCTSWAARNVCFAGSAAPDQLFRLRATPPGDSDRNGVFHSAPLDHGVPEDSNGTSLNFASEAVDDSGPLVGDWDINFWRNASNALAFWAIDTWDTHLVVDAAGLAAALQPGDTVGPGSTYASSRSVAAAPAWRVGTDAFLGVVFNCDGRLTNPVAGGVCYGYVHLRTSGPSGFPATLLDYAYDGDGGPLTIPLQDRLFCSGFDNDGCGGAAIGIHTTRAQFVAQLVGDAFDNSFDDIAAGASPPLAYAQNGYAYTIETSSGLYNTDGAVSTTAPDGPLVVTFTGAPVLAIGGNFWPTDAAFTPTPGSVLLRFSDGTTHRFESAGPDAFRGLIAHVPITTFEIDASGGTIGTYPVLDNLVVGRAR